MNFGREWPWPPGSPRAPGQPSTHVGQLIGAGMLISLAGAAAVCRWTDELERWTLLGFERGRRLWLEERWAVSVPRLRF